MDLRLLSRTSLLYCGHARVDITQPDGIYHRMWGAARHDRATGMHRPLYADALALSSLDGGDAILRLNLDLVGLAAVQHDEMVEKLSCALRIPFDRIVITYTHTHGTGLLTPNRIDLPGGELIEPYLDRLQGELIRVACDALGGRHRACVTYAHGHCSLAGNRDCPDPSSDGYVCGFNPVMADDCVMVGRISDEEGKALTVVVNYACHPTTLAWDNTLISPDFVGGLREVVEREIGCPCVFFQGACGDLGPRRGFVGDTSIADGNGRQLAYATLEAWTSMGPPATDFAYAGPVVSGATLGTWTDVAFEPSRQAAAQRFTGGSHVVELAYRDGLFDTDFAAELDLWLSRQKDAIERDAVAEARDCGARAERARRWIARLEDLPRGEVYPLRFSVHLLGDAIWCTCGGEPYNKIQLQLRHRFPDHAVLFSPLAGNMQVAYLLPEDCYGIGLYQEEPSCLAPGCLEHLVNAMVSCIEETLVTVAV